MKRHKQILDPDPFSKKVDIDSQNVSMLFFLLNFLYLTVVNVPLEVS